MQYSDAYILKSELALRRHAVLEPADVPDAKRQKTTKPAAPRSCARAHAFVSGSPLSPSKSVLSASAAATESAADEIKGDPAECPEASSGQEATFAVRSDSEFKATSSEPARPPLQQAAHTALQVPAAQAAPAELLTVNTSVQPVDPDPHPTEEQAVSHQQSTAGPGTSGPSSTSQETKLHAAEPKEEADSPSSPHLPDCHASAPAGAAPAVASAQPVSNLQTNTPASGPISVQQLLSAGPYQVDAQQRRTVADILRVYKAKVDELHASGRVSLMDVNAPVFNCQCCCRAYAIQLSCCTVFSSNACICITVNLTACCQ